MPKRKIRLNSIYLKAAVTLAIYMGLSQVIFLRSMLSASPLVYLGIPIVVASISGCAFLYIFSHEEFFKFAREIEKREMKIEQRWLRIFKHLSMSLTTFAIGTVGGPVLSALTARLLLRAHCSAFRYTIVVLTSVHSVTLSMGIAKGLFSLALG